MIDKKTLNGFLRIKRQRRSEIDGKNSNTLYEVISYLKRFLYNNIELYYHNKMAYIMLP